MTPQDGHECKSVAKPQTSLLCLYHKIESHLTHVADGNTEAGSHNNTITQLSESSVIPVKQRSILLAHLHTVRPSLETNTASKELQVTIGMEEDEAQVGYVLPLVNYFIRWPST